MSDQEHSPFDTAHLLRQSLRDRPIVESVSIRPKVLLVDDDRDILESYERILRKEYAIHSAEGVDQAVEELKKAKEPFAVIISDMRMPGRSGLELLQEAAERAPDSVRIMLTGHASQQTAVSSINEGRIFRFLTKPCRPEALSMAIYAGVRQYELITAERVLLSDTLHGSVKLLTDILSMMDPHAFSRGDKLRTRMRKMAEVLKMEHLWELDLAALLFEIGMVTVPPDVLIRMRKGALMSETEEGIVEQIPRYGQTLISNIPRLEGVAEMILYQNKYYDGRGFPDDPVFGENIPEGARLLTLVRDLSLREEEGEHTREILLSMREERGRYDPLLINTALNVLCEGQAPVSPEGIPSQAVACRELRPGQVLVSDIVTMSGMLIVSAGYEVTPLLLERLRNFSQLTGIREPVYVEIEDKTDFMSRKEQHA